MSYIARVFATLTILFHASAHGLIYTQGKQIGAFVFQIAMFSRFVDTYQQYVVKGLVRAVIRTYTVVREHVYRPLVPLYFSKCS